LVAATLAELEIDRALVVHGAGGLDELSLAGETLVAEVKEAKLRRYTVTTGGFWRVACAAASDRRWIGPRECGRYSPDFPGRIRRSTGYRGHQRRSGSGGFRRPAENFLDAARLADATISSGAAEQKADGTRCLSLT